MNEGKIIGINHCGARFLAAIVNQHQLSFRYGAVKGQDTAFKQFHLIPKGNDDTDIGRRQLPKDLRFEGL